MQYLCVCELLQMGVSVCVYIYIYIYVYISLSLYLSLSIYIYIYIYSGPRACINHITPLQLEDVDVIVT